MAKTTKKAPAAKAKLKADNSAYYLYEARLRGYKTLKDCSVDFKPGLNIIIGKNGAGKTNFLSLLTKLLNKDLDKEFFLDAEFELKGENKYKIIAKRKAKKKIEEGNSFTLEKINYSVFKDGKKEQSENEAPVFRIPVSFQPQLIKHGIPDDYLFFQRPYSFNSGITEEKELGDLFKEVFSGGPYFKNCVIASLLFLDLKKKNEVESKKIILEAVNKVLDKIKPDLFAYTEVQDIKFRDSFSVYNTSKNIYLSDLQLEFFVNSNWMLFDQLSDGTKRALFIISEIALNYKYIFGINSFGISQSVKRIILLEEPELSIHPHLLSNLMSFIKEQSKEKQIILTTHSPQVLDILNKDELDRIIIASYEPEKGTQMRHLSKAEQQKAKKYIETIGFLSDYWRLSDLEK